MPIARSTLVAKLTATGGVTEAGVLPTPVADSKAGSTPQPAANVPELAWLTFSGSSQNDDQIIVRRGDRVGPEDSPVDISMYFDYSPRNGQIAYATDTGHAAQGSDRSVSDLWVYDYRTETAEQWLPDNVTDAYFVPVKTAAGMQDRLVASYFDPQKGLYDLVFVDGPNQTEHLADCGGMAFSGSPDGEQFAYVTFPFEGAANKAAACAGTSVVSYADLAAKRASNFGSQQLGTGSIGDRPLWIPGENALIFPDNPFWVVPLGGGEPYIPSLAPTVDHDLLYRPANALWSPEYRYLIGDGCGGELGPPPGLILYRLSEDMHQIEEASCISAPDGGNVMLVSWWEPGESILVLVNGPGAAGAWGDARVWSLKNRDWVAGVPAKP